MIKDVISVSTQIVSELGPKVAEWLELVAKNVEDFLTIAEKIIPDANSSFEVVDETFTKDMLLNYVRKYAVDGANGMAVIFKSENDNDIFYFASVKDKELIDDSMNNYGAIKVTDGVKREVKDLFASAMQTEFGKLLIIR